MILFLLASGLSLVLGVMGILNLAHGGLYVIGAYVGWTVTLRWGGNFWLGALLGSVAAGLIGLFMERLFLTRLYKQLSEQVLLTFGFAYILTNISTWIWTAESRAPFTPPALSGPISLFGVMYPAARVAIIGIGLALALGLWWLQDRTRVGAIVRAGMDDREMTMGLGINLGLVSSAVFFLGAAVAGFSGVIGAQMIGVNPALTIDVLLLALVVIIVGGVGSVQGALLGGIVIGMIDAFGKPLSPALSMSLVYIAMIVILLIKPSGLLGRRA